MNLQRTVNSVLTVCLSPGDHPTMNLSEPGDESLPPDLVAQPWGQWGWQPSVADGSKSGCKSFSI